MTDTANAFAYRVHPDRPLGQDANAGLRPSLESRPEGGRAILVDIEEAVDRGDYSQAIERISRSAELFVEWGMDLPLDRLEALLRVLNERRPDHPWVLYYLAWLWSTQRRHSLARVTLNRAEQRFESLLVSEELARASFLCRMAAGVIDEREGLFKEARQSFRQAIEMGGLPSREGARSPDEIRWIEHDPSGGIAFWLDAMRMYDAKGLSASAARVRHNLGTRLLDRGEPVPARGFLETALELKLGSWNRVGLANTLNSLGHTERHLGLSEGAARHLGEALDLSTRLAHDTLRSYVLNNLAEFHRDQGRFDTAADMYRESLEIKRETDNVFGLAHTYASQADMALQMGDPAEARSLAERAVALRVPGPDPVENARLLSVRARACLAAGEPPSRVAPDLAAVTAELEGFDMKGEVAVARWWLAACLLAMGDHGEARVSLTEALRLVGDHRLQHVLAGHATACPEPLLAGIVDPAVADVAATVKALTRSKPVNNGLQRRPIVRPVLTVRLFGDLAVLLDGHEVPLSNWRSKKAVSLLAMLLHHRGELVHREQAIEWLWPQANPERSGKNLNVALTALRRGLEQVHPHGSRVIERQGSLYRMVPDGLDEVDVLRFLELHSDVGRLARDGSVHGALAAAQSALDLAVGEYLASERYAEWAIDGRNEMRELVIDLRLRVAEWCLDLERPSDAAWHAGAVLSMERWRERAWSTLVRAHIAQGDRAAALRTFERCQTTLEDELGIAPSPDLAAVARSLLR